MFGGKIVVSGGKALGVLTYLSFLSAAAYAIWAVSYTHLDVYKRQVYAIDYFLNNGYAAKKLNDWRSAAVVS